MKVEPVNATSSADVANGVSMKSEQQNVTVLGTPVLAGANRESVSLPVKAPIAAIPGIGSSHTATSKVPMPTAAMPNIGWSHTSSSETSTPANATLGYRVLNVMRSPLGSSAAATIQARAEVVSAPANRQDEAVMTRAAFTPAAIAGSEEVITSRAGRQAMTTDAGESLRRAEHCRCPTFTR
ncbi:hypothetical protein D8L93_07995 [Sodalis-like symbiont of Bactericera trigonica]|nr:hypothetical protein D8L93_07995 [Sodalis-like symbiont of Bactericera trigonica]